MSVFRLLFVSVFLWGTLVASGNAIAQAEEEGEVLPELSTPSKNAIFKADAIYKLGVKNTYNTPQEGTISYQVTTKGGVIVKKDAIKVNIAKKSSASYNFNITGLKSGFYKVNFMINVSYYDDTIRKAFGIRPEEIKPTNAEPKDFDKFWKDTRAELAAIAPAFKMTLLPDTLKYKNRNAYRIEMVSLDSITINGYLTVPKRKGKFPVILGLPGYQVSVSPLYGVDDDLALLTLDVRGQGLSRNVIHTPRNEYIFYHIEDKNRYVMRGVIMDCIRAIDFICSRPELDQNNIMVSGGSMGGFLAIATAALDNRVKLCSAQNPIMSDVRNLEGEVDWPVGDIQQYVKTQPGLTYNKVLDNLDYFDTKNFAARIKCDMLLGMGLLDHLVPPANAYVVYNRLQTKKHIIIFRDLGHEVGQEYVGYEGRWTRDAFALF
jgi:cephalosporin-C deacetylase